MAIELTERLLMDAGGWQAAKHARALVDTGRVISAAYNPPLLKGVVREGDTEYRAGLKVSSKTNIENICSCRQSREWGTICPHSLAVGFAYLKPKTAAIAAPVPAQSPPVVPSSADRAAQKSAGPSFIQGQGREPDFVALYVILPPQFLPAWERGNLTAGVEAERGGRRVLLNALPSSGTFHCSESDLRLIEALRALSAGATPGMLSLTRQKFVDLLAALRGHPRVTLGKANPAHVSAKPLKPKLEVKTDSQNRAQLHVHLPADVRLLAGGPPFWSFKNDTFTELCQGLPQAYAELLTRDITLPAEQVGRFLAVELPGLRPHFELVGDIGAVEGAKLTPESGRFSLSLEGSLNHLTARLQCIYLKRVITLGVSSASETWAMPDPQSPARILTRNLDAERAALSELTRYGFTGPDSTGYFTLKGERAILAFFAEGYPQLQKRWDVSLGARFGKITENIERIVPRVEITSSGEEWFEMQFDLATGSGDRFSAAEVQRLLQMGQNHVKLKNGKTAVFSSELLDDFQTVLRDCNPKQRQAGSYKVGQEYAGYLDAAISEAGFRLNAPESWRNWACQQRGQKEPEPVALGDLEGVLRSYQKYGISWLTFLASNGLGGILADDMGLGKTLQALAFLRLQPGPALVVCPSSLVFNWVREAQRFTPDRKVIAIEGSQRAKLFTKIPEADLIITSYPLLRRDIDRYRSLEFSTAILDEAQHIKNPDTQNAQAASILRAKRKFILTGTPVENSVRDLWSLMNFVLPGYLGDRDDFRERYEIPIARHNSKEDLQRLSKRIRPFLLRRKKQDVSTDLPEKLEQVAYCELSHDQQKMYSALLQGARSQVEEAIGQAGGGKARMLMLTALLRLRQAACDIRLLKADADASSGKVELFGELLQEAIDGGHRVLVFSQFVSMLQLIRADLEKDGVEHCYLDGQTKDRAAVVDHFQSSDVPVFLISLKAGGVGLNLTGADTVIHFDPWWNPAVEAQATDRAHRIGQKNVVTSYKLISRGTVEEKILNLQRKKREIIDAAIENEEPLMEALSMDEIQSLIFE